MNAARTRPSQLRADRHTGTLLRSLLGSAFLGSFAPGSSSRAEEIEIDAHPRGVTQLAISPDSAHLASVGRDGTLAVWTPQDGQLRWRSTAATDELYAVAVSSRDVVAAAGSDHCVRVHDLGTGEVLRTLTDLPTWVVELAFDPSGELLVLGSATGWVRVYGADLDEPLREFTGRGTVGALAFSPDGEVLAIGGSTLELVDPRTGERLRSLVGHRGRVSALCFSPDGSELLSASHDRSARRWNLRSGECLQELSSEVPVELYVDPHAAVSAGGPALRLPLTSVAYSPDGTAIGIAGAGRMVRWWRLDGTDAGLGAVHAMSITGLERAPDGSFVVSGSLDGTLRIRWSD